MKTVKLNNLTLKKNGTPIELMGVTSKNEAELIESYTLSEQTNLITFENSENVEYKAIYIHVRGVSSQVSTSLYVGIGLRHTWASEFGSVTLKGGASHLTIPILSLHKLIYCPYQQSSSTQDNSVEIKLGYITQLHIYSTQPLLDGTKIDVYGVKK